MLVRRGLLAPLFFPVFVCLYLLVGGEGATRPLDPVLCLLVVFMLVYKGAPRPLDLCFVLFMVCRLVERGLLAPLISLVVIIALVTTPRPFLCVHKEKGKEMHLLKRRRGLCETRKRVSRGVVLVITFLRRIALVKGAVRVLLSLKTLV